MTPRLLAAAALLTMVAAHEGGGVEGQHSSARPTRGSTSATTKAPTTRAGGADAKALAVVRAFYRAIDTKDFTAMAALASPRYEAIFGPGCANVGGASHCGEATMTMKQLQALIARFPTVAREGEHISRAFSAGANGVVLNHYDVKDSAGTRVGHGAAIHHVVDAQLEDSFWYGTSDGGAAALAACPRGTRIRSPHAILVMVALVLGGAALDRLVLSKLAQALGGGTTRSKSGVGPATSTVHNPAAQ